MATERLTKFEDLVAYLTESKIPHRADAEHLAVQLPVDNPPNAGAVFVRWERGLPYVQVIYAFLEVPPARIQAIESAICRANNSIKLPGFGFEYDSRYIYMRLAVQLYDGGIPAESFRRMVLAVLENARELVEGFRGVVNGAEPERVVELAIAAAKASATKPS